MSGKLSEETSFEERLRSLMPHLQPMAEVPTPLSEDFYKEILNLRGDEEGLTSAKVFPSQPRNDADLEISRIADDILRQNDDKISEASSRLAASTVPVPDGPVFRNLLSPSFNETEFIQEHERELERQRKTAAKAIRRSF